MNGSDKEGVNDKGDAAKEENEMLYGFKVYKGYFIMGDYFVALGAGLTNMQPEIEGNLRTTIDQTALVDDVYTIKKGNKTLVKKGEKIAWKSDKKNPVWISQKGSSAILFCLNLQRKRLSHVRLNLQTGITATCQIRNCRQSRVRLIF